MELVYLWVEDYKNIQKLGFIFSPNFDVKFTPIYENEKLSKKSELIVTPKENSLKDFFGKNINITAIVGENGSGKSAILNAIINSSEGYFPNKTKYILVFSDEKVEYYTSNFTIQTQIIKCKNTDYKRNLIGYLDRGNNNDKPIIIQDENEHNIEIAKQVFRNYQKIDVSKTSIVRLLAVEIGKINSSFEISTFMYLPNKITMKLKEKEELIGRYITFFAKDREKIKKLFLTINDPIHHVLFLEGATKGIKDINILQDKNELKKQLIEKNIKYKTIEADISKVLSEKTFDISELTDDEKNKYIGKYSYFYYLDFNLIDKENRRYNDLSHGEQMIFGQLLNLYFYTSKDIGKIFLFDEPEIALHPDWQKKYLNEVVTLLQRLNKTYQFIFTTHSPFLLSDLPKENVIFLETYKKNENKNQKEGNCKNVTSEINIETFGANIHTLLSHGFFMKDGLMGEFAKEKINEAIKYLNQKTVTKKEKYFCKSIISIIGEPFLQAKLEQMYNEKFGIDDEIGELQKQQEKIKQKIEQLKKQKSENVEP